MDIALQNGRIIDPETRTDVEANVYIKDGRIESIGQETLAADQVLDASGLVVCPGFIDIHMHREDEVGSEKDKGVSTTNEMGWLEAGMGVTTAVGGNCGMGPPDFKNYMGVIEKIGTPINYMTFSGHAILREVCGQTDRYTPAKADIIRVMAGRVRQALEEGAVGLSIGLEYTPGASFEELLGVIRPLTDFPGALVSIHYRYDADRALESIDEMIALADESKAPLEISHLNSCAAFGLMPQALKKLETAIKSGVDLSIDTYPYDAFCTFLGSAVFDPGCLERWGVDYDALLVATGSHAGERFNAQLFERLRQEEPDALVVAFVMQEAEVEQAIAHPLTMVASDGLTVNGQGHPRGAGTFPRVLGFFSRQKGLLDLIEAIRKMTLLQ
ncbi:MAG: amidohydrolase family protein, partial [Deltaproteobacteria bacterium]|nr:amidohydrolase family protein [Deltaproteobacteria bacterium]